LRYPTSRCRRVFYAAALGFEPAENYRLDEGLHAIMELESIQLDLQFLRRAAMTLELMEIARPPLSARGSVAP
jgi:hypothetical protein